MKLDIGLILCTTVFLTLLKKGYTIQCYQCDSNEDETCPADRPFDKNINAMVNCGGFEAKVPGTFCLKVYQESPGWFGWVKITRRCGSISETGVAVGCRWEYIDSGVFKETCFCYTSDGCNGSSTISTNSVLIIVSIIAAFLMKYFSH
ncbi:UPAR/Ly6 domain-containing protein CG9338-like [Lineus longissimus]|uniref:UPAR/Ly6 domain-containing protein CG9338-like n=1 Tax=Lineus longissimus TaxID=88925 RepID=UPI002B4E8236